VRATCQRGKKERGRETQAQRAGARKKAMRGKLGQNGEKGRVRAWGRKRERGGVGGPWLTGPGERKEREKRETAGRAAGERKEWRGGGQLGWAQMRREGEGKRRQTNQRLLSLKLKFEFKRETTKISMQEHEMHKHMTLLYLFLYLRKIAYQKSYDSFNLSFYLIFCTL
jgi:hypothetical protein